MSSSFAVCLTNIHCQCHNYLLPMESKEHGGETWCFSPYVLAFTNGGQAMQIINHKLHNARETGKGVTDPTHIKAEDMRFKGRPDERKCRKSKHLCQVQPPTKR